MKVKLNWVGKGGCRIARCRIAPRGTRHSTQAKREYNRIKKQESRARMTSQKKAWVKKREKERRAKSKANRDYLIKD